MPALRSRTTDFYDPNEGGSALRIHSLRLARGPHEPARTNYFAVYRIETSSGAFSADDAHCEFGPGSLLFCVPYQYVRLDARQKITGDVLEFHANFLCVETFHAEVGCSGTLFNDPYRDPVLPLEPPTLGEINDLFARIRRELTECNLAYSEAALACLKLLLILATRLKLGGDAACTAAATPPHPILRQLIELIEQHYSSWHSPAQYAAALHMTPKTLGRVVREQLGTNLTDLIRRRILTHVKWQLLHTLRPVKEIAREVGFHDELYFSRLFKKATGVSPTYFREFETAIRGGSNLSMSSRHPSILPSAAMAENLSIGADDREVLTVGAAKDSRRRQRHGPAKRVRTGGPD